MSENYQRCLIKNGIEPAIITFLNVLITFISLLNLNIVLTPIFMKIQL